VNKAAHLLNNLNSASSTRFMGSIMSGNERELTSLTAEIVAAYVSNNVIGADKLADFIGSVYAALSKASAGVPELQKVELIPAVPVKKSVTQDFIICLEDGKKFKSLKRHLKSCCDLSPEEYRKKMEPAARLSDGRPSLCSSPVELSQEHGPWPAREGKSRQAALFDCRRYRACGESGKGQAYPERGLAPLFVSYFTA
jgi:predicted transcriptional regulator